MPIEVDCENCSKSYRLSETLAGKTVRCKECGSTFRVPEPKPKAQPKPAATAAPKSAAMAKPAAAKPKPKPKPVEEEPDFFNVDENEFSSADDEDEYDDDEYEEAPPRRRSRSSQAKPARSVAKRKKSRRSEDSDENSDALLAKIILSVLGATFCLAFISPVFVWLFVAVTIVCMFGVATYGGILGIIVMVEESVMCFLLCFAPLIGGFWYIYYLITRWELMRRPFLINFSSLGIFVLAYCGMVLLNIYYRGNPFQLGPAIAPPGIGQNAPAGFPLNAPPGNFAPIDNPATLFPVSSVPVPKFPDLGLVIPGGGGKWLRYDIFTQLAGNPPGPGNQMQMRLYLPVGQHAPKSLGCVLVAPAGSNLMVGNGLDDGEYVAESIPYVEAGYAVVQFSLDGGVPDLQKMSDSQFISAHAAFAAAQAGLVNARNAFEFVLAKVPQVDPGRIYCAGHSSAGVLSLLFAEHEPRLKACIAFAPASDVETRLAPAANDPNLSRALPLLRNFLKRSSPKTHIANLNCPLFLFHARDDSNEPIASSVAFAAEMQRLQKRVTFVQAASGDHYDSMVKEGIPQAINWLKTQKL